MRPVGFAKLFGFVLAAAAMLGMASVQAAPTQNKAVVRGVSGTANYSNDKGANWKKLNVGAQLNQASIIRTAPGARVDLFLGDNGPVVRVTEDTTLALDRLTSEKVGDETIIETQLDLRNGRILGHVKKLAQASKYEVKTPQGVAGIRGTQYDIRADGTVHVIEGQIVVVYIVGGVASTAVVNAGQTATPPTTAGGMVTVAALPPGTGGPIREEIMESIQIVTGPRQDGGGGTQVIVTINPDDTTTPQNADPAKTPTI